jgi:hypothetical protein
MKWIRSIALVGLAVGCGGPQTTNTGYAGTWSRGSDAVRSTLSIVREGESYLVRWRLRSADGQRSVDCDWAGACVEHVAGDKASEFTMSPSVDPTSGNLIIEVHGTVFKPEAGEMHYRDELTVRTRGQKMIAHTLEEAGRTWERGEGQPRRIFNKVSDDVEDPPPARRGA